MISLKPSEFPLWKKKGLIFSREKGAFFKSHVTRPIPFFIKKDVLRIFFGSRCASDTYHPTYIDVNPENPSEVFNICERSILDLGKPGSFDDSGIYPVSIVRFKKKVYIQYYAKNKRTM